MLAGGLNITRDDFKVYPEVGHRGQIQRADLTLQLALLLIETCLPWRFLNMASGLYIPEVDFSKVGAGPDWL
jgi:hypothetical protein